MFFPAQQLDAFPTESDALRYAHLSPDQLDAATSGSLSTADSADDASTAKILTAYDTSPGLFIR